MTDLGRCKGVAFGCIAATGKAAKRRWKQSKKSSANHFTYTMLKREALIKSDHFISLCRRGGPRDCVHDTVDNNEAGAHECGRKNDLAYDTQQHDSSDGA